MKTIAVRVSDEDHKLFHQLAEREYMPISVLVRRVLMQLADERGLTTKEETAVQSKPAVVRRPIPTAPNAWRDEIVRRVNTGERLQDVADSYGANLDTVKAMYKRGKENEAVLPKDVWNDPAQLGAINDAKFKALVENI
jgi:hypothetical protein